MGGLVVMPEEEGDLLDHLMDQDRRWFELHPGQVAYLRPSAPSDFFMLEFEEDQDGLKDTTHVLVREIGPGVRTRNFYRLPAWRGHIFGQDEFFVADGVVVVVPSRPEA